MSTPQSTISPTLSVVLIVRHPQETPDAVLAALASERARLAQPAELEVIVADGRPGVGAASGDGLVRILRPGLNLPLLKAEGLALVCAAHVAFLEPKGVPMAGWLRAALDALRTQPDAALGGPVIEVQGNAVDRAAYAFEYSAFSRPRVSQDPPADLPGNNMILPTAQLRELCGDILDTEGLNKPFCQARLKNNGVAVLMIPEMAVQLRTRYRLGPLLASRYRYARCFGGTRAALAPTAKRWSYRLGAPIVSVLLLYRHIGANFRVTGAQRLGPADMTALAALCFAWAAGEAAGSWFGAGTCCENLY